MTQHGIALPTVNEIDSVAALEALDDTTLTSLLSFHLAAYYCATGTKPCEADGGEGLFVQKTMGCSSATDDGGSILKVDHGSGVVFCFYRQNLNGDLRQWGLTQNSDYDAIYAVKNSETLLNATNQIENAITALGAIGITRLHTKQVNLLIGLDSGNAPLRLLSGWSFTCDAPPVKDADKADYTKIRGSLIIAHGSTSVANFIDGQTNNDVEVYDCAAVLPEWYINPIKADDFLPEALKSTEGHPSIYDNFHVPATSYADLEAIRADMIMAGDTAIMAGHGANIHDIGTYGFDNCLNANSAPEFVGRNVPMDCPIGSYFTSNGGGTSLHNFFNNPYLTKEVGFSNEEYFTIDNVQADTTNGGECMLRLKAAGQGALTEIANSITDGDDIFGANKRRGDPISYPAWVTGLNSIAMSCLSKGTGRFGNDPAWAVEKVPGAPTGYQYIDLVGSKFATSKDAMSAVSVDTTGDWSANTGVLRISGPISNLTVGMKVTSGDSGWPTGCTDNPCRLTVVGIVARATGPDNGANSNDGYNGEVIVSPAPTLANASSSPTLSFYSGSDPPNWSDGHIGTDCDGTAAKPCFFYNAAERYVAGASPAGNASARLPASRGGHLGAAFLLDGVSGLRGVSTVSFAHYYSIAAIDAEQCSFSLIKGDDHGELTAGNTVGLYVTGQSRGCDFLAEGPGPKGAGLVQDTFGAVDQTSAMGTVSLDHYDTGTISLSSPAPSAWPARGELHICDAINGDGTCDLDTTAHNNEIVAYHKTGSTWLAVDARGRFGTAPVNWGSGVSENLFWTKINNGSDKHDDKSALTIFDAMNIPTTGSGNQFEIHHGGAVLQNAHTTSGGIGFVSTNTSGVNIVGAGLPATTLTFEDGNARILTTVTPDSQFANFAEPGLTNLPMTLLSPGGTTQHATGFSALGVTGLGPLTVSDNTGWPVNGVLAVESEEMAFALPADPANHTEIDVTARGACGTTPASHSNSDIRFLLVELPCGSAGLKGYASNGFTIGSPTGGDQGTGTLSTEKQIYENNGHSVPGIACSSGAAQAATGTTEHVLATCTITGGLVGANGCVLIDALWDWSGTNTKTIKAYANSAASLTGAVAYLSVTIAAASSAVAQRTVLKICNQNSTGSQIGGALSGTTSASSVALPTSSIITANDWYVLFTGQKSSGASEALKLEEYQVANQPMLP